MKFDYYIENYTQAAKYHALFIKSPLKRFSYLSRPEIIKRAKKQLLLFNNLTFQP